MTTQSFKVSMIHVCVVAIVVVGGMQSISFAQPPYTTPISATGTVTSGSNGPTAAGTAVPGVNVQVGLKTINSNTALFPNRTNWGTVVQTDMNGTYNVTTAPLTVKKDNPAPPSPPATPIPYKVTASFMTPGPKSTVALSPTFGGFAGLTAFNNWTGNASGMTTFPAPTASAPLNQNIVLNNSSGSTNFWFSEPAGSRLGRITSDPQYTYTVTNAAAHQGIVNFSSEVDPTDPNILIAGLSQYANGTVASRNGFDQNGHPINENLFGNTLQISNLSVLGLDGNGNPMFGNGTVAATDGNGNTLFSADLVNVRADAGGLVWYGNVANALYPDESMSQTLADWHSQSNQGASFEIAFDPSFTGLTNNFSQSATMASDVSIGTVVPEPGTLTLLAIGACIFAVELIRRRRAPQRQRWLS